MGAGQARMREEHPPDARFDLLLSAVFSFSAVSSGGYCNVRALPVYTVNRVASEARTFPLSCLPLLLHLPPSPFCPELGKR